MLKITGNSGSGIKPIDTARKRVVSSNGKLVDLVAVNPQNLRKNRSVLKLLKFGNESKYIVKSNTSDLKKITKVVWKVAWHKEIGKMEVNDGADSAKGETGAVMRIPERPLTYFKGKQKGEFTDQDRLCWIIWKVAIADNDAGLLNLFLPANLNYLVLVKPEKKICAHLKNRSLGKKKPKYVLLEKDQVTVRSLM